MCTNLVTQYVPKGYGYKEISMKCGSTSIHGVAIYCQKCEETYKERYPQGYRNVPGDICKHGCYVGDAFGPDYLCPECEGY